LSTLEEQRSDPRRANRFQQNAAEAWANRIVDSELRHKLVSLFWEAIHTHGAAVGLRDGTESGGVPFMSHLSQLRLHLNAIGPDAVTLPASVRTVVKLLVERYQTARDSD
jgi:hypothetical protein